MTLDYRAVRRLVLVVGRLVYVVLAVQCSLAAAGPFRLVRTTCQVRYVEYEYAVKADNRGVPVFSRLAFDQRPQRIVTKDRPAIVLENDRFRASILPSQGRLHSFVNRRSGSEMLWINPVAHPLGANNDTKFWMTWGGIEHVVPRAEHGVTHAVTWKHAVVADTEELKAIRLTVRDPLSGLEQSAIYSMRRDAAYLATEITIHNRTSETVRFSHWTTALYAPGPQNEVTARTEIIVPADRFVPDDRDFNAWMKPLLGGTGESPLRFIGNWRDIGDLMTSPLKSPYYGVYSHECREGVLRTFDLRLSPGFNVWGWGFPPTEQRQREFTSGPANRGYVEIWNGTGRGFGDDALIELQADGRLRWVETLSVIGDVGEGDAPRVAIERQAKTVLQHLSGQR